MNTAERVDALLLKYRLSIGTYSRDMLREELISLLDPPVPVYRPYNGILDYPKEGAYFIVCNKCLVSWASEAMMPARPCPECGGPGEFPTGRYLMVSDLCQWTGRPHSTQHACLKPASHFIHACPLCPQHAEEQVKLDEARDAGVGAVRPEDRKGVDHAPSGACEGTEIRDF